MPDGLIEDILVAARQPEFRHCEDIVALLLAEGFSVSAALEQLMLRVLALDGLPDSKAAAVAACMASADKCLVDGADGHLQLLHVVSVLHQALR